MQHLKLFLLLPLALASCSSTPEFEHRSPAGLARSDDESVARMLAMMANIFSAQVCATLRVEQTPPFVIYHVPSRAAAGMLVERDGDGNVLDRRIEIGDRALDVCPRFLVAHELVHWYARGPWEHLPHAIEEGLADYIALQLVPEAREQRLAEHTETLASMTPERRAQALAVRERAWTETPREVRSDAYAVGFEIVQRLGVEGLRELCERAQREGRERVPLAWIEGTPLPPHVARH